jgi:hypothetical protein
LAGDDLLNSRRGAKTILNRYNDSKRMQNFVSLIESGRIKP